MTDITLPSGDADFLSDPDRRYWVIKPKSRVAHTYRRSTRAERRTAHAIRMNAKAQRRAETPVGFHPVANDRITKAYQAHRAAIAMSQPHLKPHEAHNEAINNVRHQLPPLRRGMFTPAKPSKQDTVPGYMKQRYVGTQPQAVAA